MEPSDLIRGLSRPGAWTPASPEVEVLQTHISVLFFTAPTPEFPGGRVLKVKKPVDLGFLDFSTLELRRHFCHEEVRLNVRLAPGVYLGVAPIRPNPDGPNPDGQLIVGEAGEEPDDAVGWGVLMHRLPADRMLEHLLDEGQVDNDLMNQLADLLARFHASAARSPAIDVHGAPDAVAGNVGQNFEQLEPFVGDLLTPERLAFVREQAHGFLGERRELMQARVSEGRVCEGHGDLHASNICFPPNGVTIFDCIEFSERLRCGDVAADLAFLAMDMDRRGFGAFGAYLVHRYAERAGDPDLGTLVDFYKQYRAVVRAKVAALGTRQSELPEEQRSLLRDEALGYLDLATCYALPPVLLLTSGLPASGKTTLARHVAHALNAAHLASDVRRKRLAGVSTDTRLGEAYGEGAYSPERVQETYDSLLASADEALAAGRSVVVDATFSKVARRAPFLELAERHGVLVLVLLVEADENLTRRRLAARAADSHGASDADLEVWKRARLEFEPLGELPPERVLRLGSEERSMQEQCADVVERRVLAT